MSNENTDLDALMVDWLYDELDPAEAARFEEALEKDPDMKAEAMALKRTREAFADHEELEPPNSLTAIVMHEAAVHAKKSNKAAVAGGGFWVTVKSWFEPIALHPAASAMATLVLVAGVAGALYVNKGDVVSRPNASSPSAQPVAANEDNAPDVARPAAIAGNLEGRAEAPSDDPAAPPPAEEPAPEAAEGYAFGVAGEELEKTIDAKTQAADRGNSDGYARGLGAEVAEREQKPKAPARSRVLTSKKKPLSKGTGKGAPAGVLGGIESNVVSGADIRLDETKTKNKELAQGLRDAEEDDRDADKADEQYRVYKDQPGKKAKKKAESSWEEQKNAELIAFARNNDCLRAGQIANDILDRNADFYVKRVRDSSAVKSCKKAVASETRKRKARKTAKRAKKSGNAAPSKAKAAPQPDEAAVEAVE